MILGIVCVVDPGSGHQIEINSVYGEELVEMILIPSGNHTKKLWEKSACFMGKLTISVAIFNTRSKL